MNKRFLVLIAMWGAAPAAFAQTNTSSASQLEKCLMEASRIKPPAIAGEFTKVEYLNPSERGVPTFEIEIRDAEGRQWEFMCDAERGTVYEIEQEVKSASDPLFSRRAKVSEKDARATVSQLYPGKILEVEYEVESNGDPTYEYDVLSGPTRWKIEVSGMTGEIVEVHIVQWQIGTEAEERK